MEESRKKANGPKEAERRRNNIKTIITKVGMKCFHGALYKNLDSTMK